MDHRTGFAAVAGAVNMDVGGFARGDLVPGDSNPGQVRLSLGGVGRNIAHNLALLGLDVGMITALGEDLYAREITDSCRRLGIDLSRSLRVAGAATSTYLYLADARGEMAAAVSDMEIYERLTPEVFDERLDWLNGAGALVLDANLPAESIAWLCGHVRVPVFADPVSAAKADRLLPALGRIHTLKPNRLEAERLSGTEITDEKSLHRAADALLEKGAGRVFLTLGADGVLAASPEGRVRLRVNPGRIVSTTGCGDAFTAALVWAFYQGMDLADSARAGMAAAMIAAAGAQTVSPAMSADTLLAEMKKYND